MICVESNVVPRYDVEFDTPITLQTAHIHVLYLVPHVHVHVSIVLSIGTARLLTPLEGACSHSPPCMYIYMYMYMHVGSTYTCKRIE